MKMASNNVAFNNNGLFKLKDKKWLENARVAGRIAAEALVQLENHVKGGCIHSMAVLEEIIERFIIREGGSCTFENYHGFPGKFCVSINKELVHGVAGDRVLDHGDLVSFDLGVTYKGSIADTAITCIFGTPYNTQDVDLVKTTEECLMKGIEAIQVGKRLGCIGHAIYKHAHAKGYKVIDKYGGHGIDMTLDGIGIPHAPPFVSNNAKLDEGIRIQTGLVVAIEPLLVIGPSNKTHTLDDGWTVVCDNICAHFEHTLYVHEDHVEIISDRSKLI